MRLSEVNEIVHGCQYGEDVQVDGVGIDTRTLQAGELYVAIKGEQFDGNDFVNKAEQAGASAALVQKQVQTELPKILVEDTRIALAELEADKRRHFGLPLIAITGSNGKTTVKEMTAAILSVNSKVLHTLGNLNNDIGVPLTLLRLNEQHQYAVIEMGANHLGEIRYLTHYAQPDISVINNVGSVHIEGFGDIDGVSRAKAEIIAGLGAQGVAILNRDDAYFSAWKGIAGERKVISFGLSESADVRAIEIKQGIRNKQFLTEFTLEFAGQSEPVQMALAGKHNVLNALAASAACLASDVGLLQICQGLANVKPVTGRLQPLTGRLDNIIIDDSYNANPASLAAALDVLLSCDGTPWLVLGAFGELGSESRKIHQQMGRLIKLKKVLRVFATGTDTQETVRAFGNGAQYFESQEGLIKSLNKELTGKEVVLIKGSRLQRMEEVAKTLVENFRV